MNGYRLRRAGTAVVSRERAPDGRWFGAEPELLKDVRGPGVDALIERIEAAVQNYPYADTYRIWPGPNSNTFTAFVLRDVPELRVDLPPTAIGKDYLGAIPVRSRRAAQAVNSACSASLASLPAGKKASRSMCSG